MLLRFLFQLTLAVLIVSPALGQQTLREVDLRIHGIGNGSSYAAVLAKFGKPTNQKIERTEKELSCMDADEIYRTLYYSGLEVEVLALDGNRKPKVVAFTITSTKWSASGVRIGSTPSQLVRRFGKPESIDRQDRMTAYYYVTPGNLGGVNFEFIGGRLVKIAMSETLC